MIKKQITWEFCRPTSFRCDHCDTNEAIWQCHLKKNGIVVNLVLCTPCTSLPDEELIRALFPDKKIPA